MCVWRSVNGEVDTKVEKRKVHFSFRQRRVEERVAGVGSGGTWLRTVTQSTLLEYETKQITNYDSKIVAVSWALQRNLMLCQDSGM